MDLYKKIIGQKAIQKYLNSKNVEVKEENNEKYYRIYNKNFTSFNVCADLRLLENDREKVEGYLEFYNCTFDHVDIMKLVGIYHCHFFACNFKYCNIASRDRNEISNLFFDNCNIEGLHFQDFKYKTDPSKNFISINGSIVRNSSIFISWNTSIIDSIIKYSSLHFTDYSFNDCLNDYSVNVKYNSIMSCDVYILKDSPRRTVTGNAFRDCKFWDSNISTELIAFNNGLSAKCPQEGSFIGYKKIKIKDGENAIAKLLIPEDAERSSGSTNKCRCSHALVLGIYYYNDSKLTAKYSDAVTGTSITYPDEVIYKSGEYVTADSWDEDRWNDCSRGIHFFVDLACAIRY